MKKHYGLFIAVLFFLAIGVKAQTPVSVEIGTKEAIPGNVVHVPVYASFSNAPGNGVGAFDFTISFSAGVLTEFTGIDNLAAPLNMANITMSPTGPSTGTIAISWFDLGNPTFLDGKLFDLVFYYNGGMSSISFVDANTPGVTEIGDDTAEPIPATFKNGRISEKEVEPEPVPVSSWTLFAAFGLILLFTIVRLGRMV